MNHVPRSWKEGSKTVLPMQAGKYSEVRMRIEIVVGRDGIINRTARGWSSLVLRGNSGTGWHGM